MESRTVTPKLNNNPPFQPAAQAAMGFVLPRLMMI
jgi:hypothetical protein